MQDENIVLSYNVKSCTNPDTVSFFGCLKCFCLSVLVTFVGPAPHLTRIPSNSLNIRRSKLPFDIFTGKYNALYSYLTFIYSYIMAVEINVKWKVSLFDIFKRLPNSVAVKWRTPNVYDRRVNLSIWTRLGG